MWAAKSMGSCGALTLSCVRGFEDAKPNPKAVVSAKSAATDAA